MIAPVSRLLEFAGWRRAILAAGVLLLAIAGVAVYGPFLGSPYVFDDWYFFSGRTPIEFAEKGFSFTLRWLPYASLGWTQKLLGDNVAWLRAGNLLLHVANAILIFMLVARLLRPVDEKGLARDGNLIGFAAALLFCLHPVAVYAVAYLSQRSILLATAGTLLSWICLLEGLRRRSRVWLAVSVFSFFFSVFSKEHAVTAPAVALLLAWPLVSRDAALRRPVTAVMVGYAAVASLVVAIRWGLLGTAYEPFAADMFAGIATATEATAPQIKEYALPLSVLTQAALFFKYLLLWVFPNVAWMSIDMKESFALSVGPREVIGLLAYVALTGAGLYRYLRHPAERLLWLAALAPCLLYVVEFSTVRIQETFVLYRSYLWMPLALLAPATVIARLPRAASTVALVLTACALALLSVERLRTFSDPIALWRDAERLALREHPGAPGMDRIYVQLAFAHRERGHLEQSVALYSHAIALNPDKALIYNDRGTVLLAMGNIREALEDFRRARERIERARHLAANRDPASVALVYYNLGWVAYRLGNPDEALGWYERSIATSDRHSQAHNNRAVILLRRGDVRGAADGFARAVELDSRNAEAAYGLAVALRQLGETARARQSLDRACRLGSRAACRER